MRAACLEKITEFCGAESVRTDLPVPPQLTEPPLANLPPPPDDLHEFSKWAHNLAELSEQRGEARGLEQGLRDGEARGLEQGLRDGEARGHEQGLRDGEARGLEQGLRDGEARGHEQGLRAGRAADILLVLRARGVEVSPEVEQRILACADPAVLAAWLRRAATAARDEDVLAG